MGFYDMHQCGLCKFYKPTVKTIVKTGENSSSTTFSMPICRVDGTSRRADALLFCQSYERIDKIDLKVPE